MDFYRLEDWERLSNDELAALQKEDFGFIGNTKLWIYSAESDLDLSATDLKRGRSYVEKQRNELAIKFKRAVVVLLVQAMSGGSNQYTTDAPKLLHTISRNLELAGEMYRPSTEMGNRLIPRQWGDAIVFLYENVLDDDDDEDDDEQDSEAAIVRAGLRDEYGKTAVDGFLRVWNGVYTYRLDVAIDE